jgi:thioredoxin reductase
MPGQMCAALDLASIAASVRLGVRKMRLAREEWLNKLLGQTPQIRDRNFFVSPVVDCVATLFLRIA